MVSSREKIIFADFLLIFKGFGGVGGVVLVGD